MKIYMCGDKKNIIGDKLKELRKSKNYTQEKMAIELCTEEGLEWSALTVLRAEAGNRIITDYELKAIAHYFKVSSDFLLDL